MTYERWDTDTGNLVEAFDDEMSALGAAHELIALNAGVYPEMLTLLAIDPTGTLETVATGESLGVLAASIEGGDARRSG